MSIKNPISFIFLTIFCTMIFLLVMTNRTHAGDVIYVNKSAAGTNDGSSWANAFANLQDALDIANVNDEIWVAAGTYTPTADSNKAVSFLLKNGVAIYGGFNGSESSREQRDWNANQTILSGDLNGNDNSNIVADEPTRSDNSYHVVLGINASGNTILDGVIITGGNANEEEDPDQNGGGVYLSNSSPKIQNTTIIENTANADGGGLLLYASSPTIKDVTIIRNWAGQNGGGTEVRHVDSSPLFVNVSLIENITGLNGGGIHSLSGSPTLLNSTLSSNTAIRYGGGVYIKLSSNFSFENVTLVSNSADVGGGVYSISQELPTMKNTIIANNSRFSGNESNCYGTFVSYGFNLIEVGSMAEDCVLNEASNLGTDIIDEDPSLGPLADNGGATRTHALLSNSPAIDKGNCLDSNGNTVVADQRGYTRPQGNDCDIGSFELTSTITDLIDFSGYLPVILNDYCGLCEVEPNDEPAEANGPLKPGRFYSGWMSGNFDVNDYFYFDLPSPQTVELSLTNIANGHDYNLVIRDDDDVTVIIGYSGEIGNSDEYISTIEIPADRYYVQVHNYSLTEGTQPYTLLVSYEE